MTSGSPQDCLFFLWHFDYSASTCRGCWASYSDELKVHDDVWFPVSHHMCEVWTVISSNISVLTYFLFGDSKAMSRERGHVPLCSLVSCSASLHASCVLLSGCFAYGCPSYNSIMLSMIQTLYLKTTNATGLSGETSYWLRMHTVLL